MSEKKIKWIAITGTMACGKSTLIQFLKEMNYPIYDADQLSFELSLPNQIGYIQIVNQFGTDYLKEDLSLDRKKLAQNIFQDEKEKQKLEGILHPLIREKLLELKKKNQQISFVEVPLLFECGWEKDFDECWLITCSVETSKKRCMENRAMSEEEIMQRIAHQLSNEEKRKKADFVIENDGTFDQLKEKLLERLKQYE